MKTTIPNRLASSLATLTVILLLGQAGPSSAAPRFVATILDLDGSTLIRGGADAPHEGAIEVTGFGAGIEWVRGADGSITVPSAHQTDFVFRKRVDKATPLLQKALLEGTLLPAVQFRYLGNSNAPSPGTEPLAVELSRVQVVGYEYHLATDAQGNPVPMEEISLNFTESAWIYRAQDEAGETGVTSVTLTSVQATEDPASDDDRDGVPNDLDPDDDNDGIHDEIEGAIGSNPFLDDADLDLDRDGQTTAQEAIAGTRADDASDYFGIERITHRRTAEGLQVTVAMPVQEGRHYRLLASMDPRMPKRDWMILDEFDIPPGSPERAADIELNPAILQNAPQLFFHAEVEMMSESAPDPISP